MPHSKEAEAPAAQRRGGGGAGAVVILSTATVFAAAQWNRGPTLTLSGTTLYLSGKATALAMRRVLTSLLAGRLLSMRGATHGRATRRRRPTSRIKMKFFPSS